MQHFETKADFARRMGWHRSTVTRFAKAERVVVVDGLVDVAASLIRVAETAGQLPCHAAQRKQLVRARRRKLIDAEDERKQVVSLEEKRLAARDRMAKARACPERRRNILDRLKVLKEAVPDWYARGKLGLTKKAAPAELVQAKRLHLLIKKQIRRQEDEKHYRVG